MKMENFKINISLILQKLLLSKKRNDFAVIFLII